MAEVEYVSATCLYPGNPTPAVDELDLGIKDGEFMVLVGPSGSGKSTALRMLAGLEAGVQRRDPHRRQERGSRMAPKERDIAMVFQNYALYPHMSVEENMGFALKLAGVPQGGTRHAKVVEAAKLLDLEKYLDAQTEGAVRRAAPARRDGPGHRPVDPACS